MQYCFTDYFVEPSTYFSNGHWATCFFIEVKFSMTKWDYIQGFGRLYQNRQLTAGWRAAAARLSDAKQCESIIASHALYTLSRGLSLTISHGGEVDGGKDLKEMLVSCVYCTCNNGLLRYVSVLIPQEPCVTQSFRNRSSPDVPLFNMGKHSRMRGER